MTLKVCNLQGVTDALFREFMSQPGERQWCSEILHSITKGERIDSKDLLKLPSDAGPLKGSPRGSPVNSPRNHAHLSPLLLPPSPRSPLSPLQATPPNINQHQPHTPRTHHSVSPPVSAPVTPPLSSSSTFSVAISSITRSFSASLANEARPCLGAPAATTSRKHARRRPGGVGSGARASEAAAGGGAAPGGQTCPVVCYPEPRVRYTSSDRRPLPGMCWCRCSVNSKVSNSEQWECAWAVSAPVHWCQV
ncbi:uncharacterized protein DKFZp434B061-like [Portunus trituberculatus]|uniref:uncharacterized protein DKFZp434B061-like n=1 Tax=Portunus trituberculatus TaxID=210409 RepID=UPI001E1CF4AA|nr:uncharacterized protein DKFZp434B061-like [Portunus trituberculatus]